MNTDFKKAMLDLEHSKLLKQISRQQKSKEEVQILENEYQKSTNWDYYKKCELALALGMRF